jgi:hypothetical protein
VVHLRELVDATDACLSCYSFENTGQSSLLSHPSSRRVKEESVFRSLNSMMADALTLEFSHG